jgi:hypothetical protein
MWHRAPNQTPVYDCLNMEPAATTATPGLKNSTVDDRRARLSAALDAVGCVLRADSRVCRQYVEGSRRDISRVVRTMQQMKFLHEATCYAALMDDYVRRARERGPLRRDTIHRLSGLAQRNAMRSLLTLQGFPLADLPDFMWPLLPGWPEQEPDSVVVSVEASVPATSPPARRRRGRRGGRGRGGRGRAKPAGVPDTGVGGGAIPVCSAQE